MEKLINVNVGYGKALLTTDRLASGQIPKVKEVIKVTPDVRSKLIDLIPKEDAKDSKGGSIIRGDIIAADTIPAPNVELIHESTNCHTKIYLCKDNREQIIKNYDSDKPFVIGLMDMDINGTKFQILLRMYGNLTFDWFPIIRVPTDIFNLKDESIIVGAVEEIIALRDTLFLSWYGLQIALLNPVIAERFHRETRPYTDDTKKKSTAKKNNKKNPKRYVKYITIDDMDDLEFSKEKKPHHIKEPFWWVTGHWREYKKSGKKVFIKGYWKGILRDVAEEKASSTREREIVFEENDGKPYFIK